MDRIVMIGSVYEHYKGQQYKVLFIANDAITNEEVVVYEALYGRHLIWTMPIDMFNSYVEGENVERFKLVK